MSEAVDTALFNPFAPGFTDDPYPHYTRVREQTAAYQHPLGFWLVTRYDDVAALLKSGNSVDDDNLAEGPMRDLIRSTYQHEGAHLRGSSMLDRDPPDHTRLRRLVAKAFTARAIERLRPRVAALVDAMLDDVAGAGTFDLIETLAFPLPFAVITEMLGMPDVDTVRLRELTGTVVRSLEPVVDPELMARIQAADAELAEVAAEAIAWKRRNPGDDLLSALIEAEEDGDQLTDEDLIAQVALLYVAGHETTVNLIGNGVHALLRHPDQHARLSAEPGLAANAVEEMLRYDSPVQSSRRITLAPYRVGDVQIPEGAFVNASLGSANRDAAQWGSDADELRIDREGARKHVSFGAGPHHCLGAALARMEAAVTLERLMARLPGLELSGDVRWNGRINLRGLATLPVSG